MLIIASAALFLILMASISVYAYKLYAKPGRFYERLSEADAPPPAAILDGEQAAPAKSSWEWFQKATQQLGGKLPVSPQDARRTRRCLVAAGYRSETAVKVHYGIKVILAAVMLAVGFLARNHVTANPVLRVVFVIASTGVGYFGPNMILDRLVLRRQTRIRLALPDALDLMVVCMEAGLGLDQAILNVSRELRLTHPDLCQELSLVNLEMRAGKRRADSLRNLADRTGEPELRKLVATMIQADKFGTSVAEALRTHSDFMRVRRRQDAEERAAKVGVKLVFPIFFFLLPSMIVVALGPGLLRLFKGLIPLMQGFQ